MHQTLILPALVRRHPDLQRNLSRQGVSVVLLGGGYFIIHAIH
jgi:hypothetical protein